VYRGGVTDGGLEDSELDSEPAMRIVNLCLWSGLRAMPRRSCAGDCGGLVSGLRRGVDGAGGSGYAESAGGRGGHRGIVLPRRHALGGIITPQ